MNSILTEYQTYRKIVHELHLPILPVGLEPQTLKNLYQSKLVYLESLRVKCFCNMNQEQQAYFTKEDYVFILSAMSATRQHLQSFVLKSITQVFISLEAHGSLEATKEPHF